MFVDVRHTTRWDRARSTGEAFGKAYKATDEAEPSRTKSYLLIVIQLLV